MTDPRNIGSIIRSAVAFNINGIIVKERSFPAKSKLLYKSASGGVEHIIEYLIGGPSRHQSALFRNP